MAAPVHSFEDDLGADLGGDSFAWACPGGKWVPLISPPLAEWLARASGMWCPMVQMAPALVLVARPGEGTVRYDAMLDTILRTFPRAHVRAKDTPGTDIVCEGFPLLHAVTLFEYSAAFPTVGPGRMLYDHQEQLWRDSLAEFLSIASMTHYRLVCTARARVRASICRKEILLDASVEEPSSELFNLLVASGWSLTCPTQAATGTRCTLAIVSDGSPGDAARVCSICHSAENETGRREAWQTLSCGHAFHYTCQERWAESQPGRPGCALCRAFSDI